LFSSEDEDNGTTSFLYALYLNYLLLVAMFPGTPLVGRQSVIYLFRKFWRSSLSWATLIISEDNFGASPRDLGRVN
jgi:hypothetical protein